MRNKNCWLLFEGAEANRGFGNIATQHKMGKEEKKERHRTNILQQLESSKAESRFAVARDGSSFCSCSLSMVYAVRERMSTSFRKSPSQGKETD